MADTQKARERAQWLLDTGISGEPDQFDRLAVSVARDVLALVAALDEKERELDRLRQEAEHPFDASEFKALFERAEAAEARADRLEQALRFYADENNWTQPT